MHQAVGIVALTLTVQLRAISAVLLVSLAVLRVMASTGKCPSVMERPYNWTAQFSQFLDSQHSATDPIQVHEFRSEMIEGVRNGFGQKAGENVTRWRLG